jgi:hypothetical protein
MMAINITMPNTLQKDIRRSSRLSMAATLKGARAVKKQQGQEYHMRNPQRIIKELNRKSTFRASSIV